MFCGVILQMIETRDLIAVRNITTLTLEGFLRTIVPKLQIILASQVIITCYQKSVSKNMLS
jgi:hypothetical protein